MSVAAGAQPGLDGVAPFRFACRRSGRCCTHGDGFVWLGHGEAERLAGALDLDARAFRERFVRTAPDPRTGALREALREDPTRPGRCALLAGDNECTVYAARPEHCARFPFWPSVLADRDGFERARAVCPGIEPEVDPAARERAFAELEALYAELDAVVAASRSVCLARGVCCRFEEAGHELFATGLEADFAAAREPDAAAPEAPGRCPYHRGGLCTARGARPVGCRTYFCDPATTEALQRTHEAFLRRVRAIERTHGLPATYARFPALLADRGVGRSGSGASPVAADGGGGATS